MQYVAIVNGEERQVDIEEASPGRYHIKIDGRSLEVDASAMSDTTLSLLVDDRSYDIESERLADGGQNLLVRGHVVHVDVLDLRKVRLRRVQEATGADTGPVKITSPMPGKVVAILVKEGDTVAAGQGLLVVEAMKMENELKAPRAGVVKNLTATEGTPVDGGATLCVIE